MPTFIPDHPAGQDAGTERCQLLAGHDGRHALMFTASGRRHVLS